LSYPSRDKANLQSLTDEGLEKFNLFDIRLKELYQGSLIDLIDYDQVRLVKKENLNEAGYDSQTLGESATSAPSFPEWFRGSKVSTRGKPLPVYHGMMPGVSVGIVSNRSPILVLRGPLRIVSWVR